MKTTPSKPSRADQAELHEKTRRAFARKLIRWLKIQAVDGKAFVAPSYDHESGDEVILVAIELPRQPGQLSWRGWQVQVAIRDYDGMFV